MRPAKISIIVGHDKKEQGAVLRLPDKKVITEYQYNTRVAAAMKELSPHYNCIVNIFLRDNVGRLAAKRAAIAAEPDVILELLFNGSTHPEVRGAEILCSHYYNKLPLPRMILESCVKVFGGQNRGIKNPSREDNGWMNVKSIVPLFLLEPFFGSNELQAKVAMESVIEYAQSILADVEECYGNSAPERIN